MSIQQSFDRIVQVFVFPATQVSGASGPSLQISNTGTLFSSKQPDGTPGFRIKFNAMKVAGPTPQPNPASIYIYNLGKTSRALFEGQVNNQVVLQAGYGTSPNLIFKGGVWWAKTTKQGSDYVTEIKIADGSFAFQQSAINTSFGKGTSFQNVFNTLAGAFSGAGIGVGHVQGIPEGSYNQGVVMQGKAVDNMRDFCDKNNLVFSIQDGMITVTPYNTPNQLPAILLNVNTGLIGIPEVRAVDSTQKGSLISVKSLLNGKIGIGQQIQVTSLFVNGTYTTVKVTHSGDSWGGEYYTEMECA